MRIGTERRGAGAGLTPVVDASRRIGVRVDVAGVAPPGCATLAADVIAPSRLRVEQEQGPAVLLCFPGGGMSRRYFDLAAPDYSFAEHLAARGYVVVVVDHAGVGDSDVPDDPWALTPEVVADADARAVHSIVEALRKGSYEGIEAFEPAAVVGVGHSAGAMVVVRQQGAHRPFDRLVLLGWTGDGLPQYLDDEDLALGADPRALVAGQVASARRRFAAGLVELPRRGTTRMVSGRVPDAGREAMAAAATPLFAVVGHVSMIPGNSAAQAAAIDVPVFIGVGERDLATDHHLIPAQLPASRDVTLFVLPDAGHNHNAEPNRGVLWDRIAAWLMTPPPGA